METTVNPTLTTEEEENTMANKQQAAVIQANSNGYKYEGKLPAAACGQCGGWTSCGGMSRHYRTLVPVMGRYGCICYADARYLNSMEQP